MNRSKVVWLLSLSLVTVVQLGLDPAFGADLGASTVATPATPRAGSANWSGPYIGGGIGLGGGQNRQVVTNNPTQDLAVLGPSGFIRVGLDAAVAPGLVVGGFLEAAKSSERSQYYGPTALSAYADTKQERTWSAGARVGAVLNDRQLWYVESGYTQARYTVDIYNVPNWQPGSTPKDVSGLFVGIGTETLIANGLSLGLEARVTQFDTANLFSNSTSTWSERPQELLARLSLNYRFGADVAPAKNTDSRILWSGLYIGGGGGYGSITSLLDRTPNSDSENIGHNSGSGYIQIGYDRVLNPDWLVGIAADYTFGKSESANGIPGTGRGKLDDVPGFAAGARLGRIMDRTLIYGTAGYTRHDWTITNFSYALTAPPQKASVDGWFVGGGTEAKLTQALSLKLEYRYERLSDRSFKFPVGEPVINLKNNDDQSVRLGITYKFTSDGK